MDKDRNNERPFDDDRQGTNKPWQRPGQASQDPALPEPKPRERTSKDEETA